MSRRALCHRLPPCLVFTSAAAPQDWRRERRRGAALEAEEAMLFEAWLDEINLAAPLTPSDTARESRPADASRPAQPPAAARRGRVEASDWMIQLI